MPLQKNQELELTIGALTLAGSGVARHEDMAVFVPSTARGDCIRAKILKVKPRYAFAKMTELLIPSPDRIPEDCPVSRQCGGCVFRHLDYRAELEVKQNAVADAFARIGGMAIEPQPICGAAEPNRYRNKAQYPLAQTEGGIVAGFYAPHSHRVVACADCLLQPKEFSHLVAIITAWAEKYAIPVYDEGSRRGLLRHIYLRKAEETDTLMVCLVAKARQLPHEAELVQTLTQADPRVVSIMLNTNAQDTNAILGKQTRVLFGEDALTDRLCGLSFRISPLSFYQVNRPQAERLYQKAAECADLSGKEILLDLYCGTGTIGLSMAKRAKRLIGVEVVEQAVRDAQENATNNGITNAEFLCLDALEAAKELRRRKLVPDVILLDPPRKGCAAELLPILAQLQPNRIVYISCDPATLARDCAELRSFGYEVKEVTPVDMFPRAGHVETVVLLSRVDSQGAVSGGDV